MACDDSAFRKWRQRARPSQCPLLRLFTPEEWRVKRSFRSSANPAGHSQARECVGRIRDRGGRRPLWPAPSGQSPAEGAAVYPPDQRSPYSGFVGRDFGLVARSHTGTDEICSTCTDSAPSGTIRAVRQERILTRFKRVKTSGIWPARFTDFTKEPTLFTLRSSRVPESWASKLNVSECSFSIAADR